MPLQSRSNAKPAIKATKQGVVGATNEVAKIKRLVALYNSIPNLLWSLLHLAPLVVFCYKWLPLSLVYTFAGLSLLVLLLPQSFYSFIQLSSKPWVYKKVGVGFINKFTQNGDFVNALIRKQFPKYKTVSVSHTSLRGLLRQTYAFERFHSCLFSFFILATAGALAFGQFGWVLLLLLSNLLYNVYPVLLQQYIRLRLRSISEKRR